MTLTDADPEAVRGDRADVYLPAPVAIGGATEPLPLVLFLPGALVDRQYYSEYARQLSRYGFATVVPNHRRAIAAIGLEGNLAEVAQIPAWLSFLAEASRDETSPLYQRLDPSRAALAGHSHGGAVGFLAIAEECSFPFCTGEAQPLPESVRAGVFYGVHRRNPMTGEVAPTDADDIPVALMGGERDGVAEPEEIRATYERTDGPKVLVMVRGADRYSIADEDDPPGAQPDPSEATLGRPEGIALLARWSALFLRAELADDPAAQQALYGPDSATGLPRDRAGGVVTIVHP